MSEPDKKIATMIWLAVDPRTPEGEAVASLQALRRMNVSLNELKLALGNAAAQVQVVEKTPEFLDPVQPWGKFKGKRLSEIAREKPDYLHWMLDKCNLSEFLATQVELALLNKSKL